MMQNSVMLKQNTEKIDNILEKGQEMEQRSNNFLNMARALNGKPPKKWI